jgi:hypothetical protein
MKNIHPLLKELTLELKKYGYSSHPSKWLESLEPQQKIAHGFFEPVMPQIAVHKPGRISRKYNIALMRFTVTDKVFIGPNPLKPKLFLFGQVLYSQNRFEISTTEPNALQHALIWAVKNLPVND